VCACSRASGGSLTAPTSEGSRRPAPRGPLPQPAVLLIYAIAIYAIAARGKKRAGSGVIRSPAVLSRSREGKALRGHGLAALLAWRTALAKAVADAWPALYSDVSAVSRRAEIE
jgi:hypothetical protein